MVDKLSKKRHQNITDFLKKGYYTYLAIKLGDQEKKYAPRIVCHTCVEHLRKYTRDIKEYKREKK